MNCPICDKEVCRTSLNAIPSAHMACFLYWVRAERSRAPQAGLPSATGSADARASDEDGADSSERSADKAVRALIQKWKASEAIHRRIAKEEFDDGDHEGQFESHKIAETYRQCAADLEEVSPALTAQRERACLPNEKGQP